jgi:RNA polymerase sigma-70 factor (ECF subfamily)
MSTPDQEQLVKLAQAGDVTAFSRLLESYRPRILAIVERQMSPALRQKLDPDDIVQDVAVSCVNAFADVDLNRGDPFEWICEMVRRRVIDAARRFSSSEKRALQREVPIAGGADSRGGGLIALLVASMTTPSAAFSRNQREFRVAAAMEQLSEESRQALRMRYLESLPTKEIAQRMQKTDGAVRVLLTRSLQRLQKILEESNYTES